MIDRVHSIINRISNGKNLTLLLTLSFLLMAIINLVNLPISVPRIKQQSGGIGILDTEIFYTSEHAYQLLDALQPAGRKAYLKFLTSLDMVFPLIYSTALAVVITAIFRRAFSDRRVQKLNLVPLGAGLFDYLENTAIITMLLKYPIHLDSLASVAGYFTLVKWVFVWASLLLFLLGLVGGFWRGMLDGKLKGD